jgi:hypothetical protein
MVHQSSALTLAIIPIAKAEQTWICDETFSSILGNIHAKSMGSGYAQSKRLKMRGLYSWQRIQWVLMKGAKRNNVNPYNVSGGNNVNPYYVWIWMVLRFGIYFYRL